MKGKAGAGRQEQCGRFSVRCDRRGDRHAKRRQRNDRGTETERWIEALMLEE